MKTLALLSPIFLALTISMPLHAETTGNPEPGYEYDYSTATKHKTGDPVDCHIEDRGQFGVRFRFYAEYPDGHNSKSIYQDHFADVSDTWKDYRCPGDAEIE